EEREGNCHQHRRHGKSQRPQRLADFAEELRAHEVSPSRYSGVARHRNVRLPAVIPTCQLGIITIDTAFPWPIFSRNSPSRVESSQQHSRNIMESSRSMVLTHRPLRRVAGFTL